MHGVKARLRPTGGHTQVIEWWCPVCKKFMTKASFMGAGAAGFMAKLELDGRCTWCKNHTLPEGFKEGDRSC